MTGLLGIWLVRPQSAALGRRLQQVLGGELYCGWEESGQSVDVGATPCVARLPSSAAPALTQKERFAAAFPRHCQWVLVMATGIAVRFLDGLIADKHGDPAVVVLDEGAHHAISLLSGH